MKNRRKIYDITYAAMIVAIFVVIHFIFPANNRSIQSALGTITPIPIAIFCFLKDFKKAMIVCFSSLAITFLFFEPTLVLSYTIPSLIFGNVLGTMMKGKMSWIKIAFLICLNVIFNLYEFYMYYLFTGVNFIEVNIQTVKMSLEATDGILPFIDRQIIYDINIALLPLIIIFVGTVKTIFTYFITETIVERLSGIKIGYKEFKFYKSSSILIEIIVLLLYFLNILSWSLILLGKVRYYFIYSVLLDIALFFAFLYYALIYNKITGSFKEHRIKFLFITLLYTGLFFIISPISAIKRILCAKNNY